MSEIRIAIRKVPLFAATVILLVVGFTHGIGTAPVTVQKVQSLNGIVLIVTGAFTMSQTNFFPTILTAPASPSPCTWSSGACQTALIQGNWYFGAVLTLNTVPLAATIYTITVFMTSMPGGTSIIAFTVPSTAAAGSGLVFLFDSGTASLVTPMQITVMVQ